MFDDNLLITSLTCINVKLKDYSLGQVCLTTGLLVLITSFAFLHSIPILLPVPRLGADQTHLAVHTPGYLLLTCTSVSIVHELLPQYPQSPQDLLVIPRGQTKERLYSTKKRSIYLVPDFVLTLVGPCLFLAITNMLK